MRQRLVCLYVLLLLLFATRAGATIFGNVRGIVHDPQHHPIAGGQVSIRAVTSDWSRLAQSNPDGEFEFSAVPLGEYKVEVKAGGFAPLTQQITVTSGSAPILHFALTLAGTKEEVQVSASPVMVSVESSSFAVYVTGAVLRPGKVTSDRPITALEAIMEAGGFDYTKANLKKVRVIRHENGRTEHFTLNLKRVLNAQDSDQFNLKPGDIVYVPERFSWF